MAKATVTVKVYIKTIHGSHVEVISAEQYEEKVYAKAKAFYENEEDFYEWIERVYSVSDVWNMAESTKKTIKEVVFQDKCLDWAHKEIANEYEEFTITTEVEVECDCDKGV